MKIVYIALFMLMPLFVITSSADEKGVQRYCERLDSAIIRGDVGEIFSLLGELESMEVWSFGAGIGPTDVDSLQFQIVQILYDFYLHETGGLLGIEKLDNDTSLSDNAKIWFRLLLVASDNQQDILRLLRDKKPAARWIGLKKTVLIELPDDVIVGSLCDIMSNDSYIKIARKPIKDVENRPSPPGLSVNEFVFPLREFACQVLNTKGYTCKLDDMVLAREGVMAIARMWERQPKRRIAIQDAMGLLNPSGAGAMAVRELGEKADLSSPLAIFYEKVVGSNRCGKF